MWSLTSGSISTDRASWDDRVLAELFLVLKDDAV